jgi:hypothetical protein
MSEPPPGSGCTLPQRPAWGPPLPLSELPAVAPFPLEEFPTPLRRFTKVQADKMNAADLPAYLRGPWSKLRHFLRMAVSGQMGGGHSVWQCVCVPWRNAIN